jgi:hypothetical protein
MVILGCLNVSRKRSRRNGCPRASNISCVGGLINLQSYCAFEVGYAGFTRRVDNLDCRPRGTRR